MTPQEPEMPEPPQTTDEDWFAYERGYAAARAEVARELRELQLWELRCDGADGVFLDRAAVLALLDAAPREVME